MCHNLLICQTCLSTNRKLFPLTNLHRVMREINFIEITNKSGGTCWECLAIMIRFCEFKKQVHLAQDTLAHYVKVENVKCLSKLSFTKVNVVEMAFLSHKDPLTVSDDDQHMNIFKEEPMEDLVQQECEFKSIIDEDNGEIDKKDSDIIKNDEVTVKYKEHIEKDKTDRDTSVSSNDQHMNIFKEESMEDDNLISRIVQQKCEFKSIIVEGNGEIDKKDSNIKNYEVTIKYKEHIEKDKTDRDISVSDDDQHLNIFKEEPIEDDNLISRIVQQECEFQSIIDEGNGEIDKKDSDIIKNDEVTIKYKEHIEKDKADRDTSDSKLLEVVDKIVITEEMMYKHREEARNNLDFKQSLYKCDSCITKFAEEKLMDIHNKKYHYEKVGAKICDICKQRFPSRKSLEEHIKRHYVNYKCKLCGLEIADLWCLWQHCKKQHQEHIISCRRSDKNFHKSLSKLLDRDEEQSFDCLECGLQLSDNKSLRNHTRKCYYKDAYTCEHCDKKFCYSQNYKRHLLIHTGMPVLKCEVCEKELRGAEGLKLHMKIHNNKVDEAAYCAECDVQYKNVYVYRAHLKHSVRHVASADMRYKCAQCPRGFTSARCLLRHQRCKHTSGCDYVCHVCSHGCKTKDTLRRHMRTKHEGERGPRNKMCDICGKGFRTKACLQQHVNSHLGRRPYECVTCGDNFSYSGALYTHVKLKHRGNKQPPHDT